MENLVAQIAALKTQTLAQLQSQFEDLFGKKADSPNEVFLQRKIAYRLQECELGGLSRKAKAKIVELIEKYDPVNNKTLRPKITTGGKEFRNMPSMQDKRLPIPGTTIRKKYKGKEIDCVVVYKVDRLSRSLLDFSQLLEFFDKSNVAFVSVTQNFNTKTSMGRLTLNILLSFAQFEREMISERTRDKMAAAKKKGRFIGGRPALGYTLDTVHHKLILNALEADLVKDIFRLYLKTKSLIEVTKFLNSKNYKTKEYTSAHVVDDQVMDCLKQILSIKDTIPSNWLQLAINEQQTILKKSVREINYDGETKILTIIGIDAQSYTFEVNIKQERIEKPEEVIKREPQLRQNLILAHQIQTLLDDGQATNIKQVAGWLNLSSMRVTQFMNMMLLAPAIQEQILFEDDAKIANIPEYKINEIIREIVWEKQIEVWQKILK